MDGNKVLALADDLTGALEVGARFAAVGVNSAVAFAHQQPPEVAVLVLDTESRHLDDAAAYGRMVSLARVARQKGVRLLYKKTDSTLRGPIAAEFRAIVEAWAGTPLLYAPAYPSMGRTVRCGVLYVGDVPVDRTEFARDPLDPVRESSIPRLLEGAGAPVRVVRPGELVPCADGGIWVVDGEAERDVEAAAAFLAGAENWRLAAGPGALAGRLAVSLDLPRAAPAPWPPVATCVVVNGSMTGVSAVQVRCAIEAGWPPATPQSAPPGWSIFAAEPQGRGLERARRLGGMVKEMAERARPDALFVIGGDTAAAVLEALGSPVVYPVGEIVPGVPLCRAGALTLITKAGGFGPPDQLIKVRAMLKEGA